MIKALIFKEWKKTKWFVFAIILLGVLLEVYLFLRIFRSVRMVGMSHIWDVVVNRNTFLFTQLKYFPIASGIVLALAQFIPEIMNKRIKLSLHLPLSERKIILTMIGYGQLSLLLLFIGLIALLTVVVSVYFPQQIVNSMLITIMPWFMAGLIGNSLIAWVCLEPAWWRRVINLLLSAAVVQLCFLSDFPAAYSKTLTYIWMLPFYVVPFVFLSVYRFKIGKQD